MYVYITRAFFSLAKTFCHLYVASREYNKIFRLNKHTVQTYARHL